MQETVQNPGTLLPLPSAEARPTTEEVADVMPPQVVQAEVVEPEVVSLPQTKANATRRWIRILIMVGGLLMMFVAQLEIFRNPPDEAINGGMLLMIMGGVIFVGMMGEAILRIHTPMLVDKIVPDKVRLKPVWLLLSIVLAGYESWRTILKPEQAYFWEYVLISFMVVLTLIMAVLPSDDEPVARDKDPLRWWEYALLVGLFVGALAARGINLGGMPYLYDQDESKFALEGADLSRLNLQASPFEPGVDSHPRIYMMTISVSVSLFGATVPAARLPSILYGAFGIPALYLLGRELFGWRIALVASLFALPWAYHILFSRLSMNQPCDPLFATLSFYYLLRGLRRGAPIDYVLSGVNLGLAQLFYLGGRLAPIVMIAFLIYLAIRQRKVVFKQWRHLLLVPMAGFIVILPQNFYLLYYHEPLSTRADKSILLNGELQDKADKGPDVLKQYITDQIRLSFGGLVTYADRSGWYGMGSNVLGPLGGPLLLLGAFVSLLLLWKNPKYSLPIGWGFSIILVTCTLGISPPEYERYFPGVTAYALLIAIGASTAAVGLAKVLQHPEFSNRILLGIGTLLLIGNLAFFLFDYVPSKGYLANRGNWMTNRVANEIVPAYNAGRQIVMFGGWQSDVQDTNVIKYLMSGKPYIYAELDVTPQDILVPGRLDLHKPMTFIVAQQRNGDLVKIMTMLPGGGTPQEVKLQEDGTTVFFRYDVDGLPAAAMLVNH